MAYTWVESYLEDLDTPDMNPVIVSFPVFIKAFRAVFGEVNPDQESRRTLLRLRQDSTPTTKHAATFRRLTVRSGLFDLSLLAIFEESLSEKLKAELATRETPDILWELDNRIREGKDEPLSKPQPRPFHTCPSPTHPARPT